MFLVNSAYASEPASEQESSSAQSSSRQAYIDEATGELTSTPPPEATLNAKTDSVEQPKEKAIEYVTHPNGTVEGKLDGHFQSELKVVLGCDGTQSKSHANDDGEALHAESITRCEESE